jgi:hypothetical protein
LRRRVRFGSALDRYVFWEFIKIFTVTAFGFPLLVYVIDLVDNLPKYLERKLTAGDLLMNYLYWTPETMFNVLPAAVLFATVFTIGAVTRHSEITAAKASGISFYRFILPHRRRSVAGHGARTAARRGRAGRERAPARGHQGDARRRRRHGAHQLRLRGRGRARVQGRPAERRAGAAHARRGRAQGQRAGIPGRAHRRRRGALAPGVAAARRCRTLGARARRARTCCRATRRC